MIIPRWTECYGNMEVKPFIQFVIRTNKCIYLSRGQRNLSRREPCPTKMVDSFLLQLKVFDCVCPWYWSVFVLFGPHLKPEKPESLWVKPGDATF